MHCIGTDTLTGCGKCTLELSNASHMELVGPCTIMSILDTVINCTAYDTRIVLPTLSKLSCSGVLTLRSHKFVVGIDYHSHNRYHCTKLLEKWTKSADNVKYRADFMNLIITVHADYVNQYPLDTVRQNVATNLRILRTLDPEYTWEITLRNITCFRGIPLPNTDELDSIRWTVEAHTAVHSHRPTPNDIGYESPDYIDEHPMLRHLPYHYKF